MDDQQLERFMGDQLRETQDFDFREEDWNALAPRLKRRRFPFIFWLVLAGLLFFGLSMFGWHFYNQYQFSQIELEKAQNALENLKIEKETPQKRKTIELVDTIYKTVVIEQKVNTNSGPNIEELALKTKTILNGTSPGLEVAEKGKKEILLKNEVLNSGIEKKQEDFLPEAKFIESLFPDSLAYKAERFLPIKPKFQEDKGKSETTKKSRPKFVGIKWGWAQPNNHFSKGDSITYPVQPPIQVFNKKALQIGVTGEVNLFKGAFLSAGVNLERLEYEFSRTDQNWDAQYENPTDTLYVQLFRIGLDQLSLRYTLGLKYQFLQNKKWRPFIGVRAEGATYLRQRLSYQFNNFGDTNDAISYLREEKPAFGLEYISPVLGFDYEFANKWKFQIEGVYLKPSKEREDRLQKKFGIHAGILFRF